MIDVWRAGYEGAVTVIEKLIRSAGNPIGSPGRCNHDSCIDESQRQALDPPRRSATSCSIPSQSSRGSPESTIRWRICHSRLPSGVCETGGVSHLSCGSGIFSLWSLPALAIAIRSYQEACLEGLSTTIGGARLLVVLHPGQEEISIWNCSPYIRSS